MSALQKFFINEFYSLCTNGIRILYNTYMLRLMKSFFFICKNNNRMRATKERNALFIAAFDVVYIYMHDIIYTYVL